MISDIVEFADLQKLSGYDRRADVERWAEGAGVPVKPCRGGVWTTLPALNHALGIGAESGPAGAYGADVV